MDKAEKIMLQRAIDKYGSSYTSKIEIAKVLGISLATLYNKINKYRLLD
ncbi:helix-turn-helix domain-containing protein [Anaeromicrobium sediminis]|uniref:DNA binding HTH domain-containing protein n=1 Tax=Anaeromicrobium sediminis TaxID=1478221 RepID=A0A267ML74_9FIRM|nr:helix-turn-helix domain-containing protein [Anaeromicrobium sediminis]PAB59635.1 hypothetical protein CCE28_08685 [Anaeromicrobium sediminis]